MQTGRGGGRLLLATILLASLAPLVRGEGTYHIGRAIADITGPAVGIKMLGYVRPDQITEGIHLRQYSRTFVIADAQAKHHLAIVTTDLQSITHSMVLSVLEKLHAELGDVYHLDNLILAATHTHAVPGGYWHNGADTPLGAPFNPEHYQALVDGITASIVNAHRDLKPGRILIAVGDVSEGGVNRSQTAYMQNPAAERAKYDTDIDTQMILLRFECDGKPIGILNWHAVHPTSMSFNNKLISSDNKGFAAYYFERWWRENNAAPSADDGPFVAAFAQSNCGDVTPNLTLKQQGPGKDEFESTKIIGLRQCDAALELFAYAKEELTGPIDYRQSYVNFGSLTVKNAWTGVGDQTTAPAAYGYSFAAGSTEDGGGQPLLFKEGMTKPDALIENLAKQVMPIAPPSDAVRKMHQPKPILLAPGATTPPLLPNVLPVGVARIGQLGIAVGPAEYTTMSGRRFREAVKSHLPGVEIVAVAGYANDFLGYVATREEYEVQHYEGASTLYGPWTQAGYAQEFARLAADIAAGRPSATTEPPADMRGVTRPTPLATKGDDAPPKGTFGKVVEDAKESYKPGEFAAAAFWSGNPQNGYRPNRVYAVIERQRGDTWQRVCGDGDWEVKLRFKQPKELRSRTAPFVCRIEWDTREAAAGTYRVVHHGVYKTANDGELHEFTGTSRVFQVGAPKPTAESKGTRAAGALKVLTWNIQMLPTFPPVEPLNKGQAMRAPWIVEFLNRQDYDVVVLQEVIDKKMTALLKQGLSERYPHQVSVDSKRGIAGCVGGVLFVSRIPLKYVDHIVYKNVSGVDGLAEKGCVLVEAEQGGVRFQLAGTHLQAGDPAAREKEIPEIQEGILAKHKTAGVPQVLLGDMNIGAKEATFGVLLRTTEMTAFPLEDPEPFTTDGKNSWNRPGKEGRHIDHVLLNPRGTSTTITRQIVQRARREHEGKTIDLADHYGVVADVQLKP
jgi:neutral ceramidase